MSDFTDPTNWAVNEFADADLGDLRGTQRLVQLAHTLAQNPGARLPEACGSGATAKAAYRFFDHDDIEPPEMVQSHLEAKASPATCPMAASHRLPWCWPQDMTEADWSRLGAPEGLGPLGCRACQGWFVHSTLAITPDRIPLGLLAQQVWALDPQATGKSARRKQLPMTQKENQKWWHSLDAVLTAHECCPKTR